MAVIKAPVGLMANRRRPQRLGHVHVTLKDLLILTWRVSADVLRRKLPSGIEPVVYDGSALISVLMFRNYALRPAVLGFPRISCPQLNLRSYILDPNTRERGSVYFHGLWPQPAWVAWACTRLLKVTCGHLPLRLRTTVDDQGAVVWEASSPDESIRGLARESNQAVGFDPELVDLLTNAHTGYVHTDEPGVLRGWSIWHPNQTLRTMLVEEMRIDPLSALDLDLGATDFAFYVGAVDYEVYVPVHQLRVPELR